MNNMLKIYDNASFLNLQKIPYAFSTNLDWGMDFSESICEQLAENGIPFKYLKRITMKNISKRNGLVATAYYAVYFDNGEDYMNAAIKLGGLLGTNVRLSDTDKWKVVC